MRVRQRNPRWPTPGSEGVTRFRRAQHLDDARISGHSEAVMEDKYEPLQARINRLMEERLLNVNRLARRSQQTLSNVYKIVNEGSVPNRDTAEALAEVLDPDGEEELLFHRHVEELVRLDYDHRIAKAAVRLGDEPEAAEGVARLCEAHSELAGVVLSVGEALADADEPTRANFLREFQGLLKGLGLEDRETRFEHAAR